MFLVTAATGKLGRLALAALTRRAPGAPRVAGARNPDKAADLVAAGISVRALDYSRPETLPAALDGVTDLLLISGNEGDRAAGHAAVIAAAKAAGVRRIVYTSLLHADRSGMRLADDHLATERALVDSGLSFVILRNGWYHENYTENLGAALAHGALLGAAGTGRLSPAARADYAEAAAVALLSPHLDGQTVELAGDHDLSLPEIAAAISAEAGKPVAYSDLPEAAYAGLLASFGVPGPFADLLANADAAIARGALLNNDGALRELIGRPTEPFVSALRRALA